MSPFAARKDLFAERKATLTTGNRISGEPPRRADNGKGRPNRLVALGRLDYHPAPTQSEAPRPGAGPHPHLSWRGPNRIAPDRTEPLHSRKNGGVRGRHGRAARGPGPG